MASYTEGFLYRDGLFYEGTGMKGRSGVLITSAATGKVIQQHMLPLEFFGEGIVDWGNTLLEWTWQSHVGFVLDARLCASFASSTTPARAGA